MEKTTEEKHETNSINWRLDYIRKYPLLALMICLFVGWVLTARLLINHLLDDVREIKTESSKKDEVIKMWRDLKVQTDKDLEYSNRKKDTVYVR